MIEVLARRPTGICGQPATQSGGRKPFWKRGHLTRHVIARKRDLSDRGHWPDRARWREFLTCELLQNNRADARLGAGRMPALPGKRWRYVVSGTGFIVAARGRKPRSPLNGRRSPAQGGSLGWRSSNKPSEPGNRATRFLSPRGEGFFPSTGAVAAGCPEGARHFQPRVKRKSTRPKRACQLRRRPSASRPPNQPAPDCGADQFGGVLLNEMPGIGDR